MQQPQRRLWPVVLSRDEIVWMRGFRYPPRPASMLAKCDFDSRNVHRS